MANPGHSDNVAAIEEYENEANEHNVVLFAASGTYKNVESWEEHFGDRMLAASMFPCIGGKSNGQESIHCSRNGEIFPDIEWLRKQYEDGKLEVMGELLNQYLGMTFDDSRMAPYYELAEELNIPVAFHAAGGPPNTVQNCCPDFRLSVGDPTLIEEVLVRYPKMRVYVMHGNVLTYPGFIRLLQQYPHVYVDLTPFPTVLPEEGFHQMLKVYKQNRLLKRIMFGTDEEKMKETIAAYRSADFLSKDELEGIMCKNAERFLNKKNICES
jgi:hypothetical protein